MGIQTVMEQYPNAIVIGQQMAQDKLLEAGMKRAFDYVTSGSSNIVPTNDPRHISHIVPQLRREGVELIHIQGDVAVDAICLVAHDTLMECDIAYGHYNGNGTCFCAPSTVYAQNEWNTSEDVSIYRHFYYQQLYKNKSPNGYLPAMRFQCMDWTDPLVKSMGGSCTPQHCFDMFDSLGIGESWRLFVCEWCAFSQCYGWK